MNIEVVRINKAKKSSCLETLVPKIEQARDLAMTADYRFLAYLLGMARIEAASLLEAEITKKHD